MQKEILLQTIMAQVAVQGDLLVSKNPMHTLVSPKDQLDLLKKIDHAIRYNENIECINRSLTQYKDIYEGQQTICNTNDTLEKNTDSLFFYLPYLPDDFTLAQEFSALFHHEGDEASIVTNAETLTDDSEYGEQRPNIYLQKAFCSAALIPKLGLFATQPSNQNTGQEEPPQRSTKKKPRIDELSDESKICIRDRNRIASKKNRDGRKVEVESLIKKVNCLKNENKLLRNEITFLRANMLKSQDIASADVEATDLNHTGPLFVALPKHQ